MILVYTTSTVRLQTKCIPTGCTALPSASLDFHAVSRRRCAQRYTAPPEILRCVKGWVPTYPVPALPLYYVGAVLQTISAVYPRGLTSRTVLAGLCRGQMVSEGLNDVGECPR